MFKKKIKKFLENAIPYITLFSIGSAIFLRIFIKTPALLYWFFFKRKDSN